jgi:8-oxo-dGTP pyrophosphatase MutT (NUDIX family)
MIKKAFWAGGFLYNPHTHSVFLHKRDAHTLYNPSKIAFFGGLSEEGESPLQCFQREILEEIGLYIEEADVIPLWSYMNCELDTNRFIFYSLNEAASEAFILGEWAWFEWYSFDKVFEEDLTEKTEKDLKLFLKIQRNML